MDDLVFESRQKQSLLQNVQTGTGAHPASWSTSGAWGWPLPSIECQGYSPCTLTWRGQVRLFYLRTEHLSHSWKERCFSYKLTSRKLRWHINYPLYSTGPQPLWQRAISAIVRWLADRTWKIGNNRDTEPSKLLCNVYGIHAIYNVAAGCIIQPGGPWVGEPCLTASCFLLRTYVTKGCFASVIEYKKLWHLLCSQFDRIPRPQTFQQTRLLAIHTVTRELQTPTGFAYTKGGEVAGAVVQSVTSN